MRTRIGLYLSICCFLTVLSQLPKIVEIGYSSFVSKFIWIVFLLIIIYKLDFKIPKNKNIILPYISGIFLLTCFTILFSLITGVKYYKTSIFESVLLSFYVFYIGTIIGKKITLEDLRFCGKLYILSTTIVSSVIFKIYLYGANFAGSTYLYKSKNSIAVIIMTAFIITYALKNESKIIKILKIGLLFYFGIVIFLLKCRSMIFIMPVVIIYPLFKKSMSKCVKYLIIIGILGLIIFLIINENFLESIVKNFIFAGRSGSISEISSQRSDDYFSFLSDMNGKWLVGDGNSFRESLILASFIQFGVFAGSIILVIAFSPLKEALTNYKKGNDIALIFFLVSIVYTWTAFFEQLAPMGPGVRCFYLWLLFGCISTNKWLTLAKE